MDTTRSQEPSRPKTLDVKLLALDLAACSRCAGTAANLRAALAKVADLFREVGTEVVYQEIVVATADQAEKLRFESSPTVRINGRDLAIELRESQCEDCGGLCGCGDGIDCRVWMWQGVEYAAAPVALFVDALLKEYAPSDPPTVANIPFRLPENLRAFFEGREKQSLKKSGCCDESACCEAADKSACCGEDVEAGVCGCQ